MYKCTFSQYFVAFSQKTCKAIANPLKAHCANLKPDLHVLLEHLLASRINWDRFAEKITSQALTFHKGRHDLALIF